MSGILGLYSRDGRPINPETLQQMTDRLAHRGPDGLSTWHADSIGLGHSMLRTTPESIQERLPLVSDDGNCALTADARIDNRDELIAACGVAVPPSQIADSQLILSAYERWGTDCPTHLLGDFAFAIWDKARQHLFCVRDHMGVKPFYYFRSASLFAFASEIKSLFCVPEIPKQLNEVQIALHLANIRQGNESTAYENILRLPPAHSLTISENAFQFNRYWNLDLEYETRLATDEEYERAFRNIFFEAVRCRLRSASPIGSELSGGLDSSSVVCVARHLMRSEAMSAEVPKEPLHVFSRIFDAVPESDERTYIRTVIAQGGLNPHCMQSGEGSPFANIDRIFWHADEPFDLWNMAALYDFYRTVQDAEIRVLLGGGFGNNAGSFVTDCMVELARRGKLRSVFTEVIALSKTHDMPVFKVLYKCVLLPLASEVLPDAIITLKRKIRPLKPSTFDSSFVRPDFAQRTGLLGSIQASKGFDIRGRTQRERHYLIYADGYNQLILEALDKLTSACNIELRDPYLDRRVMEFCLSLPPEQRLHRGYTRAIVRRALTEYLPYEIKSRVSAAYLDPIVNRGLRLYERTRLENMIFDDYEPIDNFVDLAKLRSEYSKLNKDKDPEFVRFWQVAILWLWLRRRLLNNGT